eukprot:9478640-Pyramimonas_sp.AAC.1
MKDPITDKVEVERIRSLGVSMETSLALAKDPPAAPKAAKKQKTGQPTVPPLPDEAPTSTVSADRRGARGAAAAAETRFITWLEDCALCLWSLLPPGPIQQTHDADGRPIDIADSDVRAEAARLHGLFANHVSGML